MKTDHDCRGDSPTASLRTFRAGPRHFVSAENAEGIARFLASPRIGGLFCRRYRDELMAEESTASALTLRNMPPSFSLRDHARSSLFDMADTQLGTTARPSVNVCGYSRFPGKSKLAPFSQTAPAGENYSDPLPRTIEFTRKRLYRKWMIGYSGNTSAEISGVGLIGILVLHITDRIDVGWH